MADRVNPHLAAVVDYRLPRKVKTQAEAAYLARGRERLEKPVAKCRRYSRPGVANLDQNGVAFRNCRDSNGSSTGHNIKRIYEQVDRTRSMR